MKYKLNVYGVEDTETGSLIPNAEDNQDWQEYQVWVAEGNVADPEFSDDELEATRVTEIKNTAATKIVETMPEWKQRNNLARMLELVAGIVDLTALTTDEQTEITAALVEWANVKDIRTTSNVAEASGTDPADIVW